MQATPSIIRHSERPETSALPSFDEFPYRLRMTARLGFAILWPLLAAWWTSSGHAAREIPDAELVEREREVEAKEPKADWLPAPLGHEFAADDSVRTGDLSRALLALRDLTPIRLGERTTCVIRRLSARTPGFELNVRKGKAYILKRTAREELRLRAPAAGADLGGTEAAIEVEDDGRTTITVFEGEARMSNAEGEVFLRRNEQGVAEVGRAPRKTAVLEAKNIIQWCLYYPGVVEVAELRLAPRETSRLRASLAAYAAGDLLGALDQHPDKSARSGTPGAQVYRAAVLLYSRAAQSFILGMRRTES